MFVMIYLIQITNTSIQTFAQFVNSFFVSNVRHKKLTRKKVITMINELKNNILEEYYNHHNKPSKIAKKYNVTRAYITKVIKTSKNYKNEKNRRKSESLIARIDYLRKYNEARRKKNQETSDIMKRQHVLDSLELSFECR